MHLTSRSTTQVIPNACIFKDFGDLQAVETQGLALLARLLEGPVTPLRLARWRGVVLS